MTNTIFAASKILWVVASPGNLVLLALLFGVARLAFGKRRHGFFMVLGASLALLATATLPIAHWLAAPLENRFPTVTTLPERVDGIAVTDVAVDGDDATRRIAGAIRASPHWDGVRAVLLDGVTVGGFNVVDLAALARSVERPVVAVTPRTPDFAAIDAALSTYFPEDRGRRRRRLRSRPLFPVRLPTGTVRAAVAGATRAEASALVRRATVEGLWPEPLRLAQLLLLYHVLRDIA